MTVRIFIPRDSAALAVGAERVVRAFQAEIVSRKLDATIVRNGSRGMHWLEVLVEVETPHGRIYHIGDTGFHDGINYRAAAEKHGGFRLGILPIGAYEPRWFMKSQHQDPEEAVAGMKLARIRHAVGHHWGTFQLTNEAIEDPLKALDIALEREGVEPERFRPLRPGEAVDIPEE